MKISKTKLMFALVVGLSLGLVATTFAATSSQVVSKPFIRIGGTGNAGDIIITENAAAALSEAAPNDTITLVAPAGVTFAAAPTATPDLATALTFVAPAGVRNATNTRVVWTIATVSAVPNPATINITGISLALASTVAAGDINLNLTSEFPGNPGLTEAQLAVATATNANAIVQLVDAIENVPIASTGIGTPISNISITEAVAGTFPAGDDIVVQLPPGVNFEANVTVTPSGGLNIDGNGVNTPFNFLLASMNDTNGDGGVDNITMRVTAASTTPGVIVLSGIQVSAGPAVVAGPINATFTAENLAVLNQTLQIGTAATRGITGKVVAASNLTFAPAKAATALAAADLPATPAGRVNVPAAAIVLMENFLDDLDGASLVLTLPAGVTFASPPATADLDVTTTVTANPTGFSTMNFTVANSVTGVAGGVLIGGGSSMNITVDSTVAQGDIVATVTGTRSTGNPIPAINLTIGRVVASGVTVAPNAIIPVVGIGIDGSAINAFTITETARGSLLANAATITLTLPTGVAWSAAPTVTETTASTLAFAVGVLATPNATATITITAASDLPATLSVSGNINVASTVAPGPIIATVGGSAGATGTVQVATAAISVTATAGAIPTLAVGAPTQAVANLTLTEGFAGGLGNNGEFRLVTSAGSWVGVAPTITPVPASALSAGLGGTAFDTNVDPGWDFELATTFTLNDTLHVVARGNSSAPATVILSGLRLNVPADAPQGNLNVALVDGGLTGTGGAGIQSTTLIMGFIGTVAQLTVTPATLSVGVGGTATAQAAGGVGAIIAVSDAPTVATVAVTGTTVTVTGVAGGPAVITITDSAAPPNITTLNVTVVAPAPVGGTGAVTETNNVTPTQLLELRLSLDTPGVATAAQRWLVVTGSIGGVPLPFFLLTDAGFVDVTQVTDFGLATFSFTGAVAGTPFSLGTGSMGDLLGFVAGDTLVYGFAFSATDITGVQFGNIVSIIVQ